MRYFLLLLALVLTGTASAQVSKTTGFQLGASLYGNSATIDFDNAIADFGGGLELQLEGDTDFSGGGLGLRVGYGFSPLFTLYADLGGGAVEPEEDGDDTDDSIGFLELGGEFTFGDSASPWRPFVNVGLQAFVIGSEDEEDLGGTVTFGGGGLKVGGGVNYFLTPQLAARFSLDAGAGALTTIDVDANGFDEDADLDDSSYSIARLHLGLSYRF
jgi:hypothetical protein